MTGKKRLQVLANYLLSGAVDKDEFTMGKWPQCAIGEATRLPSLAKEGLELGTDWDGSDIPTYEEAKGFGACANFFSIPLALANKFFGPERRSAEVVGKQLMSYLKRS